MGDRNLIMGQSISLERAVRKSGYFLLETKERFGLGGFLVLDTGFMKEVPGPRPLCWPSVHFIMNTKSLGLIVISVKGSLI